MSKHIQTFRIFMIILRPNRSTEQNSSSSSPECERTKPNFLQKKHKNNQKVRVLFDVVNSYLKILGALEEKSYMKNF